MPFLDNSILKPMLRLGGLYHQWGQWMGRCFERYALRHERNTDITMIQKILGHNDLRTTLGCLRTTHRDLLKIISPLDDLNLQR